jgi:hypothetical protein
MSRAQEVRAIVKAKALTRFQAHYPPEVKFSPREQHGKVLTRQGQCRSNCGNVK